MPNTNCTCDKILITQQSVAASFSLYPSLFICLQSSAVADTLYDIEWYKCDARTRKMILMILRRSQRAKTIAVPFFTPSLPAFSSVRNSLSLSLSIMRINVYVLHLPSLLLSSLADTQHNRLIYHASEDISVSPCGVWLICALPAHAHVSLHLHLRLHLRLSFRFGLPASFVLLVAVSAVYSN